MGLEVWIVRGGILVETGCLDDVFQHTANVAIHIGDIELAAVHTLDDLLNLGWLSWFHEIVACLYFRDGGQTIANANPVCHHNTFIAPVLTQNLRQQVEVTHRELSVHLIIRCHDGPGVALTDSNLEATQIQFSGSTQADTLIDSSTICLLRIYSEVLGRYANILLLHTLNIGCCNLTRQQRVFGVVFEVTSAEGIAMQVHARAEDHVATVFLGFVADGLSHFADQFRIPGRGQTRANGECCSIICLCGTLTSWVDTYSGRAVSKYSCRYSQSWYCWRCSCCSCHQVGLATYYCVGTEKVVCTANK